MKKLPPFRRVTLFRYHLLRALAYLACSSIAGENEVFLKVYKFPDCKTNVSEKHGLLLKSRYLLEACNLEFPQNLFCLLNHPHSLLQTVHPPVIKTKCACIFISLFCSYGSYFTIFHFLSSPPFFDSLPFFHFCWEINAKLQNP